MKLRLSIINIILLYLIVSIAVITVYGILHQESGQIEASFSIYFAYVYISPKENTSFLSILLTNTGAVDIVVKSIQIDNEVITLPRDDVKTDNILKKGSQLYLDIPLKGKYENGVSYDIVIVTEPPADYMKVKAIGTLKTW